MYVLLTSGGTKVRIDRVRHIGNMSKGTFGSRIGQEFAKLVPVVRDFRMEFLYAKDSKTPFSMNINTCYNIGDQLEKLMELRKLQKMASAGFCSYIEIPYDDFDDYADKLELYVRSQPDIVVLAAAVSDYLVDNYVDGKIRSKDALSIDLVPATKLISKVKEWSPNTYLVGFKLLVDSTTEELINAAKDSIGKNKCDLVVANDLRDIKAGKHKITLVSKDGVEMRFSKEDDPNYLARFVVQRAYEGWLKQNEKT